MLLTPEESIQIQVGTFVLCIFVYFISIIPNPVVHVCRSIFGIVQSLHIVLSILYSLMWREL